MVGDKVTRSGKSLYLLLKREVFRVDSLEPELRQDVEHRCFVKNSPLRRSAAANINPFAFRSIRNIAIRLKQHTAHSANDLFIVVTGRGCVCRHKNPATSQHFILPCELDSLYAETPERRLNEISRLVVPWQQKHKVVQAIPHHVESGQGIRQPVEITITPIVHNPQYVPLNRARAPENVIVDEEF